MILGLYYLTRENFSDRYLKFGAQNLNMDYAQLMTAFSLFSNVQEAITSYEVKKIKIDEIIGISTKAFPFKKFAKRDLITTPGKLIFNQAFANDFPYINAVENLTDENINNIVGYNESISEFLAGYNLKAPLNKDIIKRDWPFI